VSWLGPNNAWAVLYGVVLIWIGFLLGWGAGYVRVMYLRTRLR
jgi:hypothetical protein